MMCLPRGELERAGDQDDQTDRDRNGVRQRRQLPLAHRRHGRAPDDCHRRAGGEEQRRAVEEGSPGRSLGNRASRDLPSPGCANDTHDLTCPHSFAGPP